MRTTSASFVLALGTVVQQAVATGWIDAKSFSNPYNTNNHCNEDQKQGYQWKGLPTGDFGTYGGLNFQGFQCANSFDKGDVLVSRTDQGKCIKGSVKKDIESGPKISCDSSKSFSIKDFRISVTIDTDLVMVYGYENGDVCKHTAPCSTAGSTITNSQCGGATSVTFHLPSHSEHEDCDVGIHHVGFDCGPPVQPPSSSSTAASSPSASLIPYPSAPTALSISYSVSKGNYSTTPVVYSASSGSTSPSAYIPVYSSGVVPQPSASVPVYYTPSAGVPVYHSPSGGVPVYHSPSAPAVYGSSPSVPGASSAPAVNGSYAPYIPYVSASTQDVVTTKIIQQILTTCPVTNTVTSGTEKSVQTTSTVSTIYITSVSTICTKCVAPPTPAPTASTQEVVKTVITTSSVTVCPVTQTLTTAGTTNVVTSLSTSTIYSTITSTICTKCVAPPTPTPSPVTQDVVKTEIVSSTVTVCPVTQTVTSGNSVSVYTSLTTSTIYSTSTSTICTKCVAPPTSVVAPPPPPPSAPAPRVLPKCLNTWITLTKCKDNADADCYCKDSQFTKNVQDCVCSWTEDTSIVQAALSYLAGICAPHVPENPGIVTDVPKTVTLVPLPAVTPLATAPPASIPATTISVVKTLTVPCTYSVGPSVGQTIPASSTISVYSTQVTVPQVQFTTESPGVGATGVPSVGLAVGSPAPVPAAPTGPYIPAGNTPAPAPYGGTTFATGVFPTGSLPVGPSQIPLNGSPGKLVSGIAAAMLAGAVGLVITF